MIWEEGNYTNTSHLYGQMENRIILPNYMGIFKLEKIPQNDIWADGNYKSIS